MTLARRARLAAGLPPAEFAKLVGTDPETYLSWETGSKRPGATASALLRVIEADPELVFRTLRDALPGRQRGSVLVVVNDEEVRAAMWEVCGEEGFDVVTVANGFEAIEHLKRNEAPCAVVVDITVPVVNGWQLLSWLRRQHQPLAGVPVITLSADAGHAEVGAREGVARHFARPLDFSGILEEIKSHCRAAA